ncbi:MAG: type II toxin-antitoxin system HicA family toxin [Methanomicrobia archaeon]|nr:type II toxin-antitoxin system HicA family toxin [Methanomicrobia archaeon]
MPNLKTLSGKAIVKIFSEFGFDIVSQRGSHVKLRRIDPDGSRKTLTIPFHDELDKGTLRAIFRQPLRYSPEEELKLYF